MTRTSLLLLASYKIPRNKQKIITKQSIKMLIHILNYVHIHTYLCYICIQVRLTENNLLICHYRARNRHSSTNQRIRGIKRTCQKEIHAYCNRFKILKDLHQRAMCIQARTSTGVYAITRYTLYVLSEIEALKTCSCLHARVCHLVVWWCVSGSVRMRSLLDRILNVILCLVLFHY